MQSTAPTLLLETKLFIPRAPRGLVPRPRLIELLDRGAASSLLLVSAPAGFGKTTLLAEWLASRTGGESVAWLSLDRGDNSPGTFWTYAIAALQTVAPSVGESALALLRGSQPGPIEGVVATLLNDLAALPADVVLVLDDYHVIDAPDARAGMEFLLEHLPPQLHLVIAGRADPTIPMARLRARGELVEVRAADLRFTAEEAVAYFNEVMGLHLTPSDVASLEARTEGWIAALQLAALSMRGRDDVAEFIDGFAGDARYVVDYLVEEVLLRQPDHVHSFLLQTSVLDLLTGGLCDAVTGQSGGKVMLETLDRENLFVVPLDDRRRWYRYHHLFADVLRARLADEQPELIPELHRRASDWFEQHGERAVAIDHALAAEDFERAAALVELAFPAMSRDRREVALRGWYERLPEDLFAARPVLSIGYVGALMSTGEINGVEARLQDAERWLNASRDGIVETSGAGAEMIVQEDEQLRRLPSWVAVYRAALSLLSGDASGTVTHAGRGLDLLVEGDELGRGAASALIGLASWGVGDLDAAHAGYAASMVSLERAGHIADVLGCAITLADIEIVQGRLRDAMRTYERMLRLAEAQPGPVLRGTADMYVGMAGLHSERGDQAAATELLVRSQALGEHVGLPQNPYRWRVGMARVREAEGDLQGAVELLDDAERVYVGDFSPNVRPIPAMRARVWIAEGRLDDAVSWAREQQLTVEDDLSYLREFEHLTLARLLLAQGRTEGTEGPAQPVTVFLTRLLRAAEDGGRIGSVIDTLVLLALAHDARGDSPAALEALERALVLAQPEGYVRVFVQAGPPVAGLLRRAAQRGPAETYARKLISHFDQADPKPTDSNGLVEPLSDRELDVLRLLATDLSGPDIARHLVVSLHTVRTHTKNIYAKLGVNNRRAAVRTAEELHLLQ